MKQNINEYSKKPRQIKNPEAYMRRLANKGKLSRVYKNRNINAREVGDNEINDELITYKKDPTIHGTGESNVERRANLQKGQFVANNIETPWQQYPIDGSVLGKKYHKLDGDVYAPNGEDMLASPALRRGVHFKPKNWGGYSASVDRGGRMMQSTKDSSDIYPIQGKDFNSTYAPRRESFNRNGGMLNENYLRIVIRDSINKVLNK